MIRRISLLILLANASMAFAQPLYKWYEADGSITFSPELPPAGIAYETVNAAPAATSLSPATPDIPVQTGGANSVQNHIASSPAGNAATGDRRQALPRVQYAPTTRIQRPDSIGSNTLPSAASSTATTIRPVASGLAVDTRVNEAADNTATDIGAASYKQSRCQDLRKRVTSLERRLKSRLTPEDMDNTVIHMARYQRSFDQYCVQ